MKKFFLLFAALTSATVFNLHATYYIAGNGSATNNWCCEKSWQADGCPMENNTYSAKVPAGTYEFKITNGGWSTSWGAGSLNKTLSTSGSEGEDNVKFTVSSEANITVTFNEKDEYPIVLTSDVPFGSATITSWTIAGVSALMGSNWNTADTNNDMTKSGDNYVLVKDNRFLVKDSYDYKACANHAWGVKEVPASGNQTITISEPGFYKITFTLNAQGTTLSANVERATIGDFSVTFTGECIPDDDNNDSVFIIGNFEGSQWKVNSEYYLSLDYETPNKWVINEFDYPDNFEFQFVVRYEETGNYFTLPKQKIVFDGKTFDYEFANPCQEQPTITYDTAMFVAGNFTNWEDGMLTLPATVNFPKDSTIEFKQVRRIITFTDSAPTDTALTWYGQTTKGYQMTRDNIGKGWTLNGEHNVILITDAEGNYGFSIDSVGHFVVTFPEKPLQIFAKNNWNGGDWTWKEMAQSKPENIYILDSVVYGGTGVNINNKTDDSEAVWFSESDIAGDNIQNNDTVKLSFDLSDSTLTATLLGRPCAGEYGIKVTYSNETTEYFAGEINPEQTEVVEYMVLGVNLMAEDSVQLYDNCSKVGWADGIQYMSESEEFDVENNKFIVPENGVYDFYFQLGSPDKLYIHKQSATSVETTQAEKKNGKRIENNHLYIFLGNHVYDAQGKMVK